MKFKRPSRFSDGRCFLPLLAEQIRRFFRRPYGGKIGRIQSYQKFLKESARGKFFQEFFSRSKKFLKGVWGKIFSKIFPHIVPRLVPFLIRCR